MLEHLSSQPSVENDVAESRSAQSCEMCFSQKLSSVIEEPQELAVSFFSLCHPQIAEGGNAFWRHRALCGNDGVVTSSKSTLFAL